MPTMFLLIILSLFLPACSEEKQPLQRPEGNVTITFWNWPEYITDEAITSFERETGIHVQITTFEDEEILFGALQSSEFQGDLMVVSESSAPELVTAQLVAPLDLERIPNARHIDTTAMRQAPTQKDHTYAIPYLAGTTGIIINTKYIPATQDSWDILWDEKLGNRIAMLNNSFEVIGAASKKLGFKLMPQTEAEFLAVNHALVAQRHLLQGYMAINDITANLVSENLWAGQAYSGDALMACDENTALRYFVPREGGARWTDMLMIPRSSKHRDQAITFINYLHRPDVMSKLSTALRAPTPNAAARELLPPEIRANHGIYPPERVLNRCDFYPIFADDDPTAQRVSELWNTLNTPD